MHHHAERVTNKNHIAMRVDNARGVRMIRRQAHDRLSAFSRAYVGGGEPPDFVLN
jgi:hypothetical protein